MYFNGFRAKSKRQDFKECDGLVNLNKVRSMGSASVHGRVMVSDGG